MKLKKLKFPLRSWAISGGLLLSVTAFAQSGFVRGKIKDASGEPIIGATITANGKAVGVTDFDGNYSINVPKGTEITVTYVGMSPKKVKVSEDLTIVLDNDNKTLNEVVVIGYGVAKKSDLTGSVSALKPDSKNKGLVVNPQDMISGKVAGVNVTTNDGTPGAGATMRIRGGSSLNASNDPLIVIDNVPIDNAGVKGVSNILSSINPQDIESFNVLKDASATAIYGSRGSNGVIIITTKRGRKGQAPQVSYSGSFTLSTKKSTIDVMNAKEYTAFIKELYGTESDAYKALGTADTNWQNEILRTAFSHDHNVTVSGSMSDVPYRVSVGYTNQQGIVKTSNFERVTTALNLNPSFLNDHLTLNLNAKGMYARNVFADGAAISNALKMDPTQDPYNYTSPYHLALLGDNKDKMLKNFGGYFEWTTSGIDGDKEAWPFSYNSTGTVMNPLAVLNTRKETANSRQFIGSADIDYKVHGFEDLRLHATLGADVAKGTQYRNASTASPQFIYYGNKGDETILKRNLSLSMYAQYFHDFKDKLKNHIDVMGGYEWQHFYRNQNNDYVGYYSSTITTTYDDGSPKANTALPHTPYKFATENYLVSFFGRANWSLLDRYYITATVRNDGSSRFKEHWAMFPSFAFAWKVNQESWLKNVNALSDLKLRLGWGKTGQQDLSTDYVWIPTYSVNTGTDSFYPLAGNGELYRPNSFRPKLKWETTTTYNAGIDWGFFNQRLSGTLDFYYRKTTDLLNYAPVMVLSSFRNQAWQNIGDLSNTGLEATISWKAIQKEDWFWTIDYNFTYNKNKITNLAGVSKDNSPVANTSITIGTDKNLEYNQVGHPANSFYVYQQVYDTNGNPIEGAVVDRNSDGKITDADRYFYKNPVAPVTMGLSSRLEYKNWDLGFALRASIGNYVFNGIEQGFKNVSSNGIWTLSRLSNTTPTAKLRGFVQDDAKTTLTDYWVQNASFLRCDNITLGYSFNNLFKTGSYKGIGGRVYATASNVFTITKYKGLDPEVFNGYDNNMYPRAFSMILGVNLNF